LMSLMKMENGFLNGDGLKNKAIMMTWMVMQQNDLLTCWKIIILKIQNWLMSLMKMENGFLNGDGLKNKGSFIKRRK
ncbi:hypothetical protein BMS83_10045, partial [Leuconostoc pseudomesenteroides]